MAETAPASVDTNVDSPNLSEFLPFEVVDKCRGSRLWAITKGNTEYVGVLDDYDEFVNMVLSDAYEISYVGGERSVEYLGRTLINGNGVTMIVPGSDGDLTPAELALANQ